MKKQGSKVGASPAPRKASTKSAAGKTTPRKPAAAAEATTSAAPRVSKNILTAGIKALSNAHEEAVARQSRVFESLLGLGVKRDAEHAATAAPSPLTAALDPFGFKKFEDVFDQRVARAMQHLDVPTAEAFAELKAEVEHLRAKVTALEASSKKR
jgi:Poly(hydroxyalcanoate) granule associated protein (phasin)